MRGTGAYSLRCPHRQRFIPDHAGNSHRWFGYCQKSAVYPRPCGEQFFLWLKISLSCGLSPTMRGTVGSAFLSLSYQRFIPDHAGNSHIYILKTINCPVYPRPCGEQRYWFSFGDRYGGLSPTMRGTGWRGGHGTVPIRFIPDHAGNSMEKLRAWYKHPVYPRPCGEQPKSI